MKKPAALLLLLLTALTPAHAQFRKCERKLIEWDKNQKYALEAGSQINADGVLFVTHAATIWDRGATIQESVNARIAQALKENVRVIYLVNSLGSADELASYYLDYKPDHLYLSSGGEHELKVNAGTMFFTGGYFHLCSSETARDAIKYAPKNMNPIHAVYLTDSLYTGSLRGTLKKDLESFSDKQTLDYLKGVYVRECRLGQQGPDLGPGYSFRVYRDGRKIGEVGSGPRVVEMDFVVNSRFKSFSYWME